MVNKSIQKTLSDLEKLRTRNENNLRIKSSNNDGIIPYVK